MSDVSCLRCFAVLLVQRRAQQYDEFHAELSLFSVKSILNLGYGCQNQCIARYDALCTYEEIGHGGRD